MIDLKTVNDMGIINSMEEYERLHTLLSQIYNVDSCVIHFEELKPTTRFMVINGYSIESTGKQIEIIGYFIVSDYITSSNLNLAANIGQYVTRKRAVREILSKFRL